jgi:hypothetical protein
MDLKTSPLNNFQYWDNRKLKILQLLTKSSNNSDDIKYILLSIDNDKNKLKEDIELNKSFDRCEQEYLININFIFDVATKHKIINIKNEIVYNKSFNENACTTLYPFSKFEPDIRKYNYCNYKILHIFLCKINYKPYIDYYKKCASELNNFNRCKNHDQLTCKKCTYENSYGNFIDEYCFCCKHNNIRRRIHTNNYSKFPVIHTFLSGNKGPQDLFYTSCSTNLPEDYPHRFIGVYLTYQSIINKLEMVSYKLLLPHCVEINFIDSNKMYKYQWNKSENRLTRDVYPG